MVYSASRSRPVYSSLTIHMLLTWSDNAIHSTCNGLYHIIIRRSINTQLTTLFIILPICDLIVDISVASITPTWFWVKFTPSIHPYAVSPDLLNLWLDSMFISPLDLELSWEIRWCTTATQSVAELSRNIQVIQTLPSLGLNFVSKKIL